MQNRLHSGCTVVEVLVATMLLGIGALALASSSAVVLRQLHLAHASSSAAVLVASRVALVASGRCGAAASGSVTHNTGVVESWSVDPFSGAAARARVNVLLPRSGTVHQFETVVPCR